MLVEKKSHAFQSLTKSRTNVADMIKQQRAQEQLEQKAKELAASVNSAAGSEGGGREGWI